MPCMSSTIDEAFALLTYCMPYFARKMPVKRHIACLVGVHMYILHAWLLHDC